MASSSVLSGSIELAKEEPFFLGSMSVDPAIRQVLVRGQPQTLEPRVMQVLVALARAEGAVVSRDALIEMCWEGRIVSEAAINRVISRLRQLAGESGDDGFQIETITKVGYRILKPAHSPSTAQPQQGWQLTAIGADAKPDAPVAPGGEPPRQPAAVPRRAMLGGGLALAAVAGAGFWRISSNQRQRSAEVDRLLALGRQPSFLAGTRDELNQAVAFLRQATELDPRSAEAWGALALAISDLKTSTADPEDISDWMQRVTSAAARSLEIDPGNADARLALVEVMPTFGNWARKEAELQRLLAAHPDHARLRHSFAFFLHTVGRHSQGIEELRRLKEEAPMFGIARQLHVLTLWTLGRLEEAEQELEAIYRIWPAAFWIWIVRFNFLALTGRPRRAMDLALNGEMRPTFPWPADISLAAAGALASGTAADISKATQLLQEAVASHRFPFFMATLYLSKLGAIDAAFDLNRKLILGGSGGPEDRSRQPDPYHDPVTAHLFMLPSAPMRSDPRFEPLVKAIGLDAYWQASRQPDYRRAPR